MDDIWLWLVVAFVVIVVAIVQQLFFEGVARTGVNMFIWSAKKLRFLRPDPNEIDINELNQSSDSGKKKSRVSKKRI